MLRATIEIKTHNICVTYKYFCIMMKIFFFIFKILLNNYNIIAIQQVLFWLLNVLCVLNFALMFYRCATGVDFVIDDDDDDDAVDDLNSLRKSSQVYSKNLDVGTQTSELKI